MQPVVGIQEQWQGAALALYDLCQEFAVIQFMEHHGWMEPQAADLRLSFTPERSIHLCRNLVRYSDQIKSDLEGRGYWQPFFEKMSCWKEQYLGDEREAGAEPVRTRGSYRTHGAVGTRGTSSESPLQPLEEMLAVARAFRVA